MSTSPHIRFHVMVVQELLSVEQPGPDSELYHVLGSHIAAEVVAPLFLEPLNQFVIRRWACILSR